jgi:hypothetical protein
MTYNNNTNLRALERHSSVCELGNNDAGLRRTAWARSPVSHPGAPFSLSPAAIDAIEFILLSWDSLSHFLGNEHKEIFFMSGTRTGMGGGQVREGGYSVHISYLFKLAT